MARRQIQERHGGLPWWPAANVSRIWWAQPTFVPRTTFPAVPATAAAARRFVADVLLDSGLSHHVVEDAVLLTSEAVTDNLAHSGGALDFVVIAEPSMARVEVHHVSEEGAAPPCSVEVSAERLRVIDAVAEAWSVETCADHGRCLWFELRS